MKILLLIPYKIKPYSLPSQVSEDGFGIFKNISLEISILPDVVNGQPVGYNCNVLIINDFVVTRPNLREFIII